MAGDYKYISILYFTNSNKSNKQTLVGGDLKLLGVSGINIKYIQNCMSYWAQIVLFSNIQSK